MDTLGLVLRLGLSLAAVLGLVWLFSKGLLKTGAGRRGAGADAVRLLARQSLSRASSVAVVQVGDRALVLGVTEQSVTLLSETDAAPLLTSPTPLASEDVAAGATASSDATPLTLGTSEDVAAGATGSSDASGVGAAGVGAAGDVVVPRQPTGADRRGALTGSALSPATWAQAVDALREKTTRR